MLDSSICDGKYMLPGLKCSALQNGRTFILCPVYIYELLFPVDISTFDVSVSEFRNSYGESKEMKKKRKSKKLKRWQRLKLKSP